MIRQIAPVFFTMNIPATLAYYREKPGFECLGTWQDPPVYAIVARDQRAIHFRCVEPPNPNPDKYADELLDAYLSVNDADALMPNTQPEAWNSVADWGRCNGAAASSSSQIAMAGCWLSAPTFSTLACCGTHPRCHGHGHVIST
jgi:hypothetical protein